MDLRTNEVSLGRPLLSDALYGPSTVINEQGPLHRRPGVVLNRQGSSHFFGRVWGARKLVHNRRLRLGTWNIGSLTGKLMEVVDTMERRRIAIACLQETRWVGHKAKEIERTGYKLWYTGINRSRNGVGIVVNKDLKEDVVNVKRYGDRIIAIKLVLGEEIVNVMSVYAPQVGLGDGHKEKFWEDLEGVLLEIPQGEMVFIGGDLNGHVGRDGDGYIGVHGGHGFGNRNEEGKDILEFSVAYDLMVTNTFFKKREEHLVTYKSGSSRTQIDFFLTRKRDRLACKDCKVIPGESLTSQHRLLIIDVQLQRWTRKKLSRYSRTKWWNLKGDKYIALRERVLEEDVWAIDESADIMWDKVAECIRRVGREVLGESKGSAPAQRGMVVE